MKKVVLLGDSIRLIGYGPHVQEKLGEGYTVWQYGDNSRFASYLLRSLYDYREQMKDADVIHFNAGLWDQCDLFGDGPFTPIDEYVATLVRVAKILKTYAPRVIFATTTPTHPAMWGHSVEKHLAYNAAAVAALEPLGVEINDLYTPVAADVEANICEDLIHLSPVGVELCATRVAAAIRGEGK